MNNYNCSTSGISIGIDTFYDGDMGRINWQENFERYYGDSTYINTYTNEKIVHFDDMVQINDYTGARECLFDHFLYEDAFEDFDSDEDALAEIQANYEYPKDLEVYLETLEYYNIKYEKLYFEVVTKGYSQGDYAEVLILNSIREAYGIKDDVDLENHFQQDIDSMFWDAPITARATINDEEFYSETFDGMYEIYGERQWDSGVFIEEVIDSFPNLDEELLRKELTAIVPDELKYED